MLRQLQAVDVQVTQRLRNGPPYVTTLHPRIVAGEAPEPTLKSFITNWGTVNLMILYQKTVIIQNSRSGCSGVSRVFKIPVSACVGEGTSS